MKILVVTRLQNILLFIDWSEDNLRDKKPLEFNNRGHELDMLIDAIYK